jgi:nicotinamide mononucleotide transporter
MTDGMAWIAAPAWNILSTDVSVGDLAGFATGLACVVLAARGSIWNFPLGIANAMVLGVLFHQVGLFGDMVLQGVFFALSIQGWIGWRNRERRTLRPCAGKLSDHLMGIVVMAVLVFPLRHRLEILGGSAPWPDALVTAGSLWAQWLLNRRSVSCWVWWIAVDLVSVPLYWSKGLPLISLLYVVFLGLCAHGWLQWRRDLSEARVDEEASGIPAAGEVGSAEIVEALP